MSEKILLVDDDANLLAAYKRQMRNQFQIEVAQDGEQGLFAVDTLGPFAVVVADLRMPVMDGIQFLSKVKQRAPDSVRIMLTGHADLYSAMEAVKEGSIFRFLTKPCPPETFAKALLAGSVQYRLVTERKQMEKEQQRLIVELQDALDRVKTLNGLLPICTHCKKIRDDKGYWNQLEEYIQKHSEAQFSHGLCPDCFKKYFRDYSNKSRNCCIGESFQPEKEDNV